VSQTKTERPAEKKDEDKASMADKPASTPEDTKLPTPAPKK